MVARLAAGRRVRRGDRQWLAGSGCTISSRGPQRDFLRTRKAPEGQSVLVPL